MSKTILTYVYDFFLHRVRLKHHTINHALRKHQFYIIHLFYVWQLILCASKRHVVITSPALVTHTVDMPPAFTCLTSQILWGSTTVRSRTSYVSAPRPSCPKSPHPMTETVQPTFTANSFGEPSELSSDSSFESVSLSLLNSSNSQFCCSCWSREWLLGKSVLFDRQTRLGDFPVQTHVRLLPAASVTSHDSWLCHTYRL